PYMRCYTILLHKPQGYRLSKKLRVGSTFVSDKPNPDKLARLARVDLLKGKHLVELAKSNKLEVKCRKDEKESRPVSQQIFKN
ncbi:hypothetical protein Ciccas_013833, partial [Cichlidogyrus casuarinus]